MFFKAPRALNTIHEQDATPPKMPFFPVFSSSHFSSIWSPLLFFFSPLMFSSPLFSSSFHFSLLFCFPSPLLTLSSSRTNPLAGALSFLPFSQKLTNLTVTTSQPICSPQLADMAGSSVVCVGLSHWHE